MVEDRQMETSYPYQNSRIAIKSLLVMKEDRGAVLIPLSGGSLMNRLEEVLVESRIPRTPRAKNLNGIILKKQAKFSWFFQLGYNMVGLLPITVVTPHY